MKILISIETKYADKIFNGTKLWEFRKVLPKALTENAVMVVYSSKKDKALVGEFRVGEVLRCSLSELMTKTESGPDSQKWFESYYKGKDLCCAMEVKEPVRFQSKLSLDGIRRELPNFRPPQNFIYIKEGGRLDEIINRLEVEQS